jgi:glutamate synthase domain-containing protein 3
MERIDSQGLHYHELNELIKRLAEEGVREFQLDNVNGQRYLGTGLAYPDIKMVVNGVPGNDLASFMNGPEITINDNAQDAIGNTMNAGQVTVHGHAGDVLGYGMRGGRLFIKGSVGYRVGIHMKEYKKQVPVLIAGGTAGDFLGEYMAGGVLVLLGLEREPGVPLAGDYLGTGMHGGVIYLRGEVDPFTLGKEVSVFDLDEADWSLLGPHLQDFCAAFGFNYDEVCAGKFCKLMPVSNRPYGRLYCS